MRLIDADALKENAFFHEIDNVSYVEEEDIDNAPTVDAVERKRGRWIHREDMDFLDENKVEHIHFMCSECGLIHDFLDGHTSQYNYCPNCGADMRGEKNG